MVLPSHVPTTWYQLPTCRLVVENRSKVAPGVALYSRHWTRPSGNTRSRYVLSSVTIRPYAPLAGSVASFTQASALTALVTARLLFCGTVSRSPLLVSWIAASLG